MVFKFVPIAYLNDRLFNGMCQAKIETIGRTYFYERTMEHVACYNEKLKKSIARYSESSLTPLCKHDIPLLGCGT